MFKLGDTISDADMARAANDKAFAEELAAKMPSGSIMKRSDLKATWVIVEAVPKREQPRGCPYGICDGEKLRPVLSCKHVPICEITGEEVQLFVRGEEGVFYAYWICSRCTPTTILDQLTIWTA